MTEELKFEDKTKELSTVEDIQESIDAVSQEMLKGLLQLPPTLAVQMAAIHRHLKQLLEIRRFLDKKKAERETVAGKEYSRQEEIDKAIEQGKAKRHRELGSEGRDG